MAINYMHQRGIVHRDIKLDNILIESMENLDIKLADFGFAAYFNAGTKLDLQLGSPLFMPPEVIMNKAYD